MSLLLFLCSAVVLFFSALFFFALTLYWSYKCESFKGVLFSAARVILLPVSIIVLWFCIMMYVIFTDKHPPDKLLPVIMLFMCFVGNFIPFGIVTAKGIKERNKARCRVGIWGLATIASLIAAFVCFAYFGCACTQCNFITKILRKKFSGFLKNLLLPAVAPVGFLAFTGTTVWQLDKIPSGQADSIFSIFAAAVCWVIFMFVPYGLMLWYGKKEQDKMKIHNGIAGIWAVNFFMLGLFLLGYICRGRWPFYRMVNLSGADFKKN